MRELAKCTSTELKIFQCPTKRCLKMIEVGAKDAQTSLKKLLRGRVDTVVMDEDQAEFRETDRTPRSVGFSRKSASPPNCRSLKPPRQPWCMDGAMRALFKSHYFDAHHVLRDAFPIE